ncbi:MAG TPA: NADP oxidoreductase [Gallionella sp.]|nr:MAG: NADP oxidoreductase [Gallionellales bacterium GWA2_54_124]HCI52409.1 NADP oxidoreductase [Gallionella sp.]
MVSSLNMHKQYLDPILRHRSHNPNSLLQILIGAQEIYGFIHSDAIDYLSSALGLPRAMIEGVASFYSFLYLSPHGEYRVLFSDNITDRMQGNQDLMQSLCNQLWVEPGKASEDGLLWVNTTSCTGMCDQGPAMLVNNIAINRLTQDRIDRICELIREHVPVSDWPAEFFAIEDNIRRRDILLNSHFQAGSALKAAFIRAEAATAQASQGYVAHMIDPAGLDRAADATLQEIKISKLRGRGGAGFSTGMKWEFCRNANGDAHYVVCNADEGEPGTFKDRVLLNSYADLVFEGMTLCAYVIGAKKGFLYLRGEYRYLLEPLQAVLQRRREQNLLGRGILGQAEFEFDIEIHLGAGAYICGEESALIESLEGKRGTPRNRPPYPVTAGYLNQPTVVSNVETFASTSLISLHGGAWYASIGTENSSGSKLFSVSGDCDYPGIYEYPFGVTVAQVLADCGAKNTQAVQISGPSGMCIAAHEFDRRISFDDIPTAGAFMVFDQRRDMFEVARNFVHFFAHESCGFCTPCRVGTALLSNMMDKLNEGQGSPYDLAEIEKLDSLLQSMSHCGLGRTACNPVLHTLAKFRPAYECRLSHKEFVPAFDLDTALSQARRMTGRDDAGAHLEKNHDSK